jgi:hypothetical protein
MVKANDKKTQTVWGEDGDPIIETVSESRDSSSGMASPLGSTINPPPFSPSVRLMGALLGKDIKPERLNPITAFNVNNGEENPNSLRSDCDRMNSVELE